MVIAGIRHLVGSEIDARRTDSFMKYLLHYLRMFAILGIVFPALIGIDYILKPKTQNEHVTKKFYLVTDNFNGVEYHIFTDSHHFIANNAFYEHINIGDTITYYYTVIFGTITDVVHMISRNVYICKPNSIYSWPLIAAILTFICSIILMFKTHKRKGKNIKYDSIINLGVINAFLCIFILIAILFHIPN